MRKLTKLRKPSSVPAWIYFAGPAADRGHRRPASGRTRRDALRAASSRSIWARGRRARSLVPLSAARYAAASASWRSRWRRAAARLKEALDGRARRRANRRRARPRADPAPPPPPRPPPPVADAAEQEPVAHPGRSARRRRSAAPALLAAPPPGRVAEPPAVPPPPPSPTATQRHVPRSMAHGSSGREAHELSRRRVRHERLEVRARLPASTLNGARADDMARLRSRRRRAASPSEFATGLGDSARDRARPSRRRALPRGCRSGARHRPRVHGQTNPASGRRIAPRPPAACHTRIASPRRCRSCDFLPSARTRRSPPPVRPTATQTNDRRGSGARRRADHEAVRLATRDSTTRCRVPRSTGTRPTRCLLPDEITISAPASHHLRPRARIAHGSSGSAGRRSARGGDHEQVTH